MGSAPRPAEETDAERLTRCGTLADMSAFLWAWSMTVALACDGHEDLSALSTALLDADRSLGLLDSARFEAAVDRAGMLLGCLHEPVSPAVAASLHRAIGVRAFGDRDPLAGPAFAAARRIEPAARLSLSLFPPESPVHDTWSAIPLDSLKTEPLPSPAEGRITLDGLVAVDRVVGLPVVFQRSAADGTVVETVYLLPGDPPPPYPTGRVARVRSTVERTTASSPTAGDGHAPLLATAAASGVAAASLWGLAVHGRSRYVDLDDPVPDPELDGLRTRTNALALGSITGAGVCVVSGALLVARW